MDSKQSIAPDSIKMDSKQSIAPEAPPQGYYFVPVAPPPAKDEDVVIMEGILFWKCNWCGLFRAQDRLRRFERGFAFSCPTCRPFTVIPVDIVLSSEDEEDEEVDEELVLEAGDSQ